MRKLLLTLLVTLISVLGTENPILVELSSLSENVHIHTPIIGN